MSRLRQLSAVPVMLGCVDDSVLVFVLFNSQTSLMRLSTVLGVPRHTEDFVLMVVILLLVSIGEFLHTDYSVLMDVQLNILPFLKRLSTVLRMLHRTDDSVLMVVIFNRHHCSSVRLFIIFVNLLLYMNHLYDSLTLLYRLLAILSFLVPTDYSGSSIVLFNNHYFHLSYFKASSYY